MHVSQSCSLTLVGIKFLEGCPIWPLILLYLQVDGIIRALKIKHNYLLFVVRVEI